MDIGRLKRRTRENQQDALFPNEPKWSDLWWGMPSFDMGDARPLYRVTVNFYSIDDLTRFGEVLGARVTTKTDTLTFPPEDLAKPSEWRYVDEP
jgi:hypothetical protein